VAVVSRVVRWVALLLVAAVLAGCSGMNGGTVDRHALTKDTATIDSIRCEAWLLSRAAARGRVTGIYTGEQAKALQTQAANLANALGSRPVGTGLGPQVRAKGRQAGQLADELRQLQAQPSAETGSRLAPIFKRSGRCS
jgi:hypothetical protein